MSHFGPSQLSQASSSEAYDGQSSSSQVSSSASQRQPSGRGRATVSALQVVRQAWINERVCPELLHYESEAVEALKAQLEERQIDLDDIVEGQGGNSVRSNIIQMDMDRANFILASYLRTRLKKIEKYVMYFKTLPESHEEAKKLSEEESGFVSSYYKIIEELFKSSFLDHIPANYHSITDPMMVDKPNPADCIVARVVEDIGAVERDGQTMVLTEGSVVVTKYQSVKEYLVYTGQMEFI